MNDLVDDPASAAIVKRLTEQLRQLQASMDDPLDIENPAVKEKKVRGNRRRKKEAA